MPVYAWRARTITCTTRAAPRAGFECSTPDRGRRWCAAASAFQFTIRFRSMFMPSAAVPSETITTYNSSASRPGPPVLHESHGGSGAIEFAFIDGRSRAVISLRHIVRGTWLWNARWSRFLLLRVKYLQSHETGHDHAASRKVVQGQNAFVAGELRLGAHAANRVYARIGAASDRQFYFS